MFHKHHLLHIGMAMGEYSRQAVSPLWHTRHALSNPTETPGEGTNGACPWHELSEGTTAGLPRDKLSTPCLRPEPFGLDLLQPALLLQTNQRRVDGLQKLRSLDGHRDDVGHRHNRRTHRFQGEITLRELP